MTMYDLVVGAIAFTAPYLLFHHFWPPSDLRLRLDGLSPIPRFLCKHLRALVFLCCVASLSLFIVYRWKGDAAALTLSFFYMPLVGLLFIPGYVAFVQAYDPDRSKRR